jgi:exonuclease III
VAKVLNITLCIIEQSPSGVVHYLHGYAGGQTETIYISKSGDHYDAIVSKIKVNNTEFPSNKSMTNDNKNMVKRKEKNNKHIPPNNKTTTLVNQSLSYRIQKCKGLAIFHINCRSIVNKIDEIDSLISSLNMDILCVSETWLNENILDEDIRVDGFKIIRKDRPNRKGGGVAIYIKESIIYKERHDLSSLNDIENIWIEIVTPSSRENVLLSCCYRPPNSMSDYYNKMVDIIEMANNENKEIIILGDMNYDYVMDDSLYKNPVFLIERLFSMTQLIKSPTRVTNASSSLLDVVLTTCPKYHVETGVLPYGLSDHYITFTILDISHQKRNHREIRFRDYKHFNESDFKKQCQARFDSLKNQFPVINPNLKSENLENMWQLWKSTFLNLCNEYAPFKCSRLKNRHNKWITPEIIKLIYKREYLHKKAAKSNDPLKENSLWSEYRKTRNEITKKIRKNKFEYYSYAADTYRNNPKKLWKEIKSVFPKNNNEVVTDITAEQFNDYFSTIGMKTATDNNIQNHVYRDPFPECLYKFKFSDIPNTFVLKMLNSLPNESKNDVLNFDTKLLRLSSSIISPSLTLIINASLTIGYCPIDWKIARVSPAFKGKGEINNETNFRPLSVIGHISKMAEKCVHDQLVKYLIKHRFITIDQFAYMKQHSTCTSLHRLIDDILENINEKEKTGLCFLDIRKCFDTIDHDILIYKLSKYGIHDTALSWFKSYLNDRSQIVTLNNKVSSPRSINIGVPQGTILGPILFLIFINDISSHTLNASINIYADDVVLYYNHTDITILQNNLQKSLDSIYMWYKRNKLSLSVEKCTSMIIDKSRRKDTNSFNLKLDGVAIDNLEKTKYLGLTIDHKLQWQDHISNIAKKVNINNFRLRRLKTIPSNIKLKIHNAMTVPIIDYANTVWGSFSKHNDNLISKLEHMAARAITGEYDYINKRGADIMKNLNMPPFEYRLKYNKCLLMYKSINDLLPNHISNNFHLLKEISQRELRDKQKMSLYVPRPNCELFKHSLLYSGPVLWNKLPTELQTASSLYAFKRMYKMILQYYL